MNYFEAKGSFKEKYPNKTIFKAFYYRDGYLFYAIDENTDADDFNDPFFYVSEDGIEHVSPVQDFNGFNNAARKEILL